jgi:hypothetical protein
MFRWASALNENGAVVEASAIPGRAVALDEDA